MSIILRMLKNKFPLILSSKPSFFPAIENGWQGNPPHKISKSGILEILTSFISPKGSILWFALYIFLTLSSISQANTQLYLIFELDIYLNAVWNAPNTQNK